MSEKEGMKRGRRGMTSELSTLLGTFVCQVVFEDTLSGDRDMTS